MHYGSQKTNTTHTALSVKEQSLAPRESVQYTRSPTKRNEQLRRSRGGGLGGDMEEVVTAMVTETIQKQMAQFDHKV